MCKRDLVFFEDQIREEYRDFSCIEMYDEINRLDKEEQTDETQLRIAILVEMTRNSTMDDMFN